MNEHQLAIAESTTSQREELKVDMAVCKQIMTVEQAQTFALQRYTSAREATAFIGHLMSTYGFLPSCVGESETLVMGDTEEIWIIEIFSVGSDWDPESGEPGAIWVAQRVPDDHALVVANWSIIKEVDEKDTGELSCFHPTISSLPLTRGWYRSRMAASLLSCRRSMLPYCANGPPAACGSFTAPMRPAMPTGPKRSLEDGHMMGYNQYIQYVEPLSLYPTSVKPERKISVQDVMAFQRSTFEGTIYDKTEDYDWYVPDGKGRNKEESPGHSLSQQGYAGASGYQQSPECGTTTGILRDDRPAQGLAS